MEVFGPDRPTVIARELTKVHEEFDRGPLGELTERWTDRETRGEFVVLVGPPVPEPAAEGLLPE